MDQLRLYLGIALVCIISVFADPRPVHANDAFDRAYELLLAGQSDDLNRATYELQRAHEADDLRATFMIGTLLNFGHGYERDEGLALQWFEYAADRGMVAAALAASNILFNPETDENLQDFSKSTKYAKQAAAAGSADAMLHLANLLWYGYGLTQDRQEAMRLLHASVELGNSNADTWLGRMYRNDEVAVDTQSIVRDLTPLAEAGNSAAQAKIAPFVYSGWNMPRDTATGEALLLSAAQAGEPSAQFTLCRLAARDKRQKEAFNWCYEAAKQDHVDAMLRLADFYIKGFGTQRDLSTALHLSWSAAFLGSRKALQYVDITYRQIAVDRQNREDAARRAKRNELIMGFIGYILTTPPPDNSVYESQQWKRYQENQRQLQRRVDELSAIGWVGL